MSTYFFSDTEIWEWESSYFWDACESRECEFPQETEKYYLSDIVVNTKEIKIVQVSDIYPEILLGWFPKEERGRITTKENKDL